MVHYQGRKVILLPLLCRPFPPPAPPPHNRFTLGIRRGTRDLLATTEREVME